MKKILFLTLLLLEFSLLPATEKDKIKPQFQNTNSENDEAGIADQIQEMLKDTTFVFNATDMMVRAGGNVSLGYDCDVQVRKNMVISYLPYMGKAYYVSPDIRNTGLDFSLPMEDYYFIKRRKGYKAGFKVRNGYDQMNFTFYISNSGYVTLTVGSTSRQSISYYGTFNARK